MTMSSANQEDDSFSSDSDDEFLTMGEAGDGGNVDREALIRRKLLESFYGKTAVAEEEEDVAAKTPQEEDDDDDDDDDVEEPGTDLMRAEDMDSPHFNAASHTTKHISSHGVHPLLETEESLACQVRTLDSSLQTLVYENYSRFIEATDAIRSIGVNVQANLANLQSLKSNMTVVSENSRAVETHVGELRDQVVEKLRVKRLLQRLDTLLKLPQTLRQHIQAGKYRFATQSYLSAYSILSKHSAGFESLQRIETECQEIMTQLLAMVRRKLIHWSGGLLDDEDEQADGSVSEHTALPDPPQSVLEILECAGTPPLLSQKEGELLLDPLLSVEECQEMALGASLRLMERILDTHHIELQEQNFFDGTPTPSPTHQDKDAGSTNVAAAIQLVPTEVLDSILEACTLYSTSFCTVATPDVDPSATGETATAMPQPPPPSERLSHFVSTAFGSFLQHVRGELLEQTMQLQQQSTTPSLDKLDREDSAGVGAGEDEGDEDANDNDQAYEQIANAMATLLQSVRQLASGLALPEVAIPAELASSLVDQTVGLTEAMVRRRVDQTFYTLRLRVIRECLAPFVKAATQDPATVDADADTSLLGAVQLASVALSDSLQLVDDTVRSILASSEETASPSDGDPSTAPSEDGSMLKMAVEQSTKRFAKWLASVMERLAGCEPSDPQRTLQVKAITPEEQNNDDPVTSPYNATMESPTKKRTTIPDDMSELSQEPSSDNQAVENALVDLLLEISSPAHPKSEHHLVLAIGEMCRVAERSLMESIHQSIASHGGGTKQRKAGSGGLFAGQKGHTSNPTSERFKLAASRVLTLYAVNRGHETGAILVSTLLDLASKGEDDGETLVEGPRPVICQALEVVKEASQDCSDLFGGDKRAGAVPPTLEDEYQSLTAMSRQSTGRSGLVFDVERMFAEKVVVLPHPNDVAEFQRDPVLTLVFKVAFKALIETSRLVHFSSSGYRQFLVDAEFLKWLLPHYVKDEVLLDGSKAHATLESLLNEAVSTAKDRCAGEEALEDDIGEKNQARAVIRVYMSRGDEASHTFLIAKDA